MRALCRFLSLQRLWILALGLLVACVPSSRLPAVTPARTLELGAEGARGAPEPFAVVALSPEGQASVSSRIQVVFNRPMRALELAGDEARPPLRLTPEVPGQWQWLGTNALVFAPERTRLPGATAFRVEVPAGTRALDGSVLPAAAVTSFETPRPALVRSRPYDGAEGLESDARFELFFNQAMDLAELPAALRLTAAAKGGERPLKFRVEAGEPGRTKRFVLVPAERLPIDSAIQLELLATARSLEGPLPVGREQRLTFRTYGPLRVTSAECSRDSRERDCAPSSVAWLELSNPVRMRDVKRSVRIEPPVKLRWDSYVSDDDWTSTISLSAAFEPGKAYKVTIEPALRDKYGQRLGPYATEFRFDDYYPALEIGVHGDYLEASRRGPIPVGSVNLPGYDLFARALSQTELVKLLSFSRTDSGFNYLTSLGKVRRVRPAAAKNQIDRQQIQPAQLLEAGGGYGMIAIAARYQLERERHPATQVKLVQVTDLGLTAKLSRTESLVWVTRLSTGEPVSGAEITLIAAKRRSPVRVLTDASGLARIDTRGVVPDWADDPALLVAQSGRDWTYRAVRDFVSPWSLPVAADPFAEDRTYGLIFTERGIYRPGDVVKVKGIVRRDAETGNAIVSSRSFELALQSPDGDVVHKHKLTTNAFGTFSVDVRVPPAGALGDWRLAIQGPEGEIWASFRVAEYRPQEFKVQVEGDQPEYRRGQTATFEIRGDYLFGAPMPGAKVHYAISRHPSAFAPPDSDGWITTAAAYDAELAEQAPRSDTLLAQDGRLDGKGRLGLKQALALPNQRGPELVTVEAEVTDLSRQSVASSTTTVVHPSDVYLGIAPLEQLFVEARRAVSPKVVALTPAGRRVAGRAVRLELVRRRWTLARVAAGDDVRSETKLVDQVVARCNLETALEPRSCGLELPEAGYYLIVAKANDALGGEARAAVEVYGLGKGESAWPDRDSHQIELVLDKKQYRVGQTARVLVKSPFPQAEALIAVETSSVKSERRVVLSGPTPTFEIPVTEEFRPNAFVSVHLLRGRSKAAKTTARTDVGAPTYRLGFAELRVDAETRRLKVDVEPGRRELRPGEELTVDVRVARSDGAPQRAEVTLYAVDEGVLSLIDYKVPDPLRTFTEPRPLRTATLETRESLARSGLFTLNNLLGLEKGAAGGGGGEGVPGVRRDFRQTAYYNASLVTGDDGKASVRFRLPDTLTTFRVMGVATSQDDRYGYGQSNVTTSKRLMARPALPRLLRAGDALEAAVIVSAKDFGPAAADVTLTASGVTLGGPATRRVDLGKDQSVEVRFPVTAPAAAQAKFRFDVHAGGQRDAVEVARRVVSPATLEAVALYGSTRDAVAERLGDFSAIRRDVGGLDVSLASTALVGLDQGAEQLVEYPYGCTEQLSSRLLPLLPLRSLATDFGFELPRDVDKMVEQTVAEILRRQIGSGGFLMWPESQEPSEWVTPYAIWVLSEAKRRGASIPAHVFDRGRAYLRSALQRRPRDPVDHSTQAFMLFVLAQIGEPDPGYETKLFQVRKELPVFARALLLHAMVVSKNDPGNRTALARELEGAVHLVADRAVVMEPLGDEYAAVMDSSVRTAAITLSALLAERPEHPLGARLARGLLAARNGGTWRSTQETAFALLALDAYRRSQERVEPDFIARIWLGGRELAQAAFRGRSLLARDVTVPASELRGGDLVFDKDGQGSLFYAARLRYARTRLPASSLDRGFYVQKTLRAVTPETLPAALRNVPGSGETTFDAGALVLADLIVVTPSPRDYVVVDDPLPAGFEAVDTSLATTAAWLSLPDVEVAEDETAEDNLLSSSPYRQELRDDRALFFADHLAAGVHRYRYLARATSRGRFVVPPAKAEEMYAPEVFGRTAAAAVEIR